MINKSVFRNIFDSLFAIKAYTCEEYSEIMEEVEFTPEDVTVFSRIVELLKDCGITTQEEGNLLSFSFMSDKGSTTYAEDYSYYSNKESVKYENYKTKVIISYNDNTKMYTIKESGFTSITEDETVSEIELKNIIKSNRWVASLF